MEEVQTTVAAAQLPIRPELEQGLVMVPADVREVEDVDSLAHVICWSQTGLRSRVL